MRGSDEQQEWMFSYISAEKRVPKDHPLRTIRTMVDVILKDLSPLFESLYCQDRSPVDCARKTSAHSSASGALLGPQ